MLPNPLPAVLDPARLSALRATGLLDSPPEVAFDRLTRLASRLVGAPIAVLSLVDGHRQFFKSGYGLGEPLASERETPLSHSYCQYAVATRKPLIIANSREHPVLKDNGATTELGIVAYAGIPLVDSNDQALGSFCVIDTVERQWTDAEVETLKELAASVMTEIELRTALRHLAEQEAVVRAVTNSAHDAMVTTDAEGTVVFWNPAAEAMFGYSAEEMMGRSLSIVIPPRLHSEYRSLRNTQYVGRTVMVPRLRKDGSEFTAELSLSRWSSDKGTFFTGIVRDITERTRQSERLRQMEEQLSLTVEHAPIGMAMVGIDGRFLRVNKALAEIVGYTPEEFVTKTFQEITHPDDLQADLDLLHQLIYGEIPRYKLAKRYLHKSGRVVDIMLHVSIVRGAHGEPNHFIAQIEDVTAINKAAAELAQKTLILESVLNEMNEGVMVVDARSEVVLKNPAASKILGPGPINYDATNPAYLLSPDGERPFQWDELAHARALRGEHVDQIEVFYRGKPGRPGRWHSVSAAPLHQPGSGGIWGAVVVGRDITRLKEADFALREQTATIQLLQAVVTAANQATNVQEALQQALVLVCEFTGRAVGHVYLTTGSELTPTALWYATVPARFSAFREITSRTQLFSGLDLPGRVFETGRPACVEDAETDPSFLRARGGEPLGIHGGFAFPVLVGAEVVAVFECYADKAERYDARLLDVMMHIGVQLGRVVERERYAEAVRSLSLTDELTGLHNRRGFMTLAEPQLRAALRAQKAALILFIDMDGLKQINDQLGHETGDEAIRALSGVLKRTFRDSDIVARLGGDEFVAFLPETNDVQTPERRLQEAVTLDNVCAHRDFTLALSVGAVAFDPRAPVELEELLQRADSIMYEQKRQKKAKRESLRPRPVAGRSSVSSVPPSDGTSAQRAGSTQHRVVWGAGPKHD